MRVCEGYMSLPEEESILDEEGEEEDPMAQGGADPMAQGGADPMAQGGADPMGGGADQMAGGADPMAQGGADMGADPMAQGGEDPMASGADMGADPMAQDADMGEDPFADQRDDEEEDGDVIDIDDLTLAQDKLNVKQNQVGRDLSKVDSRIISLIDTIKGLQAKLDTNNSEIEALKAEFEKRNPTQTEKLNLRSLDSYPFNVKPSDYWADKEKEGVYQPYSDNDESTTKEYTITADEVDNPSSDIAKSFFSIDDDDIQTLDKLFKF